MSGLLAAGAVLLGFAALWQLAAERGEGIARAARRVAARASRGRVGSVAEAALALGVAERLDRAGFGSRYSPAAVLGAKVAGAVVGVGCAAMALPAVPGRLDLVVGPLLAVGGFMAPDAFLEREARLRGRRIVVALPDALELLAVGAACGRPPTTVIRELSASPEGPLALELAATAADLDCGRSESEALGSLRRRVPAGEVAALAAALERSRRYGSPLAEQLHAQAAALRADARRRVEESASRAAPKIQLVVALVLVPSVLLMILAAIVAHSDALLGGL